MEAEAEEAEVAKAREEVNQGDSVKTKTRTTWAESLAEMTRGNSVNVVAETLRRPVTRRQEVKMAKPKTRNR